jgi:hypothetical protein
MSATIAKPAPETYTRWYSHEETEQQPFKIA